MRLGQTSARSWLTSSLSLSSEHGREREREGERERDGLPTALEHQRWQEAQVFVGHHERERHHSVHFITNQSFAFY